MGSRCNNWWETDHRGSSIPRPETCMNLELAEYDAYQFGRGGSASAWSIRLFRVAVKSILWPLLVIPPGFCEFFFVISLSWFEPITFTSGSTCCHVELS
jgi:hypothetical protein